MPRSTKLCPTVRAEITQPKKSTAKNEKKLTLRVDKVVSRVDNMALLIGQDSTETRFGHNFPLAET